MEFVILIIVCAIVSNKIKKAKMNTAIKDFNKKQEQQEEQRLRRETGGKAPAMRHYYGDSVPHGMRLVRCGYCAADNLVAVHANVKNYTCYFCREDL